MNETIRTIVFVAAGAVAALAAFATRPSTIDSSRAAGANLKQQVVGKPLFPGYTDALLARSLEIKQFDEGTAKIKNFRVEESASGVWTIPSHGGYPADAADQLRSVSEQLAGLEVLGLASEEAADHELFGVNDPTTAAVGATGVGTLITLADAKGNELVNLIVGKSVEGNPNQHFVRKPKEDIVTVTTIDMTKLPTQFDKWIEKDLLKISTFDVSQVTLKDYAILPTETGRMGLLNRMEAALAYDSSKGEWTLQRMLVSSQGGQREVKLGEQEELNKQKLDDLRNGLGDVKIVDVLRKPAGLGNSLRISPDQLTRDQQIDLQDVGFYPQPTPDGKLDIYGANGEVLVETKDGVVYVLRFGDIAENVDLGPPPKTEDGSPPEDQSLKIHRYLFVTTQVASSVLTPPVLEPEPAGPAAEPPQPDDAAKKAGDAKQADEKSDATKPPVLDPKQAELERIRTENKRKMDEYNDKKKKAEVRVKELNARFADWYYVVAEDVYKKIRLVRSDIVKESAGAKEEGFGPDAFRSLEQGGVKGAAAPPPPSTPSFNPGGGFPPM